MEFGTLGQLGEVFIGMPLAPAQMPELMN